MVPSTWEGTLVVHTLPYTHVGPNIHSGKGADTQGRMLHRRRNTVGVHTHRGKLAVLGSRTPAVVPLGCCCL